MIMVGVHTTRVTWTKVTVDGSNSILGVATDLTGLIQVQVNTKLGKSADSFTIKLFDIEGGVEDYWRDRIASGDLLKVYSSTDGGVSEVLEIDGIVKQVSKKISPDDKNLVFTGLNRLESLLGLITPIPSLAGQTQTPDYWIRLIIREANTQNDYASYAGGVVDGESSGVTIKRPDRYIIGGTLSEWIAAGNPQISTSYNTTSRFYKGDQIAFETIEELSSETYAGIQHYFYLDGQNQFIWKALDTVVSGPLPDKYESAKFDKNEYDIVNYVIISAGKNLYGNATIKNFKYDLVSATENGIRAKTLYTVTGEVIVKELNRKMKSDGYYDASVFPFSDTYPFTLPAEWTNKGSSVANDAALNIEFVDEVIIRTNLEADTYLTLRTSPTMKSKRVVPDEDDQQTNFVLGGYYTDPYSLKKLRVQARTKTFTAKKGWVTDLTMEEDYDKIKV